MEYLKGMTNDNSKEIIARVERQEKEVNERWSYHVNESQAADKAK